uniref:Putative tail protein n=1 Tax=viral metagenome TaxID=1070528 RepID=A0A6M3IKK2_9ZZZZ
MSMQDLWVRLGLKSQGYINGINKANAKTKQLGDHTAGLGRKLHNLKQIAVSAFAGWGLMRIVKDFIETGVAVDRMMKGLAAATGGKMEAAKADEFLRKESERLGLVFQDQIDGYQKLSAATAGTALAGENLRQIYLGVAEASTALQLGGERSKLILYAVQQMVSKGTITMEELRRQMGDSLPGAFELGAKAMGLTTQVFSKMIETGKMLAVDFLPRFAIALREKYAGAVIESSKSAQAQINRLKNAWFDLKRAFMDTGVTAALANTVKEWAKWLDWFGKKIKIAADYWFNAFGATKDGNEHLKKRKEEIEGIFAAFKNAQNQGLLTEDDAKFSFAKRLPKLRAELEVIKKSLARVWTETEGTPPMGDIPKPAPFGGGETAQTAKELADHLKFMQEQQAQFWNWEDEQKTTRQQQDIQLLYDAAAVRATYNETLKEMDVQFWNWEDEAKEEQQQKDIERIYKLAEIQRSSKSQAVDDARFFFAEMGKHSKAAFKVYQGVELAYAAVSTITSAAAAYENGMIAGGPYAGPYLAAAYAAAAIAAGAARMVAIASQSPDGGASVGGVGGGGAVGTYSASPINGLPETNEADARGSLTIIIQGDVVGDDEYIDRMAEKISKAVEDRDVRFIASNAKYADALT